MQRGPIQMRPSRLTAAVGRSARCSWCSGRASSGRAASFSGSAGEPTRSVGVVGLGTAGAATAILLARQGHRVTVFEKTPEAELCVRATVHI